MIDKFLDTFKTEKIELPKTSIYGACILETRTVPKFDAIVNNHMNYMPVNSGLVVFHSSENEEYIKRSLSHLSGVKYHKCSIGSMEEYNKFLTTEYFWSLIPFEKVLIFQTDSLLLRKGIEKYFDYDYIGAPWGHFKQLGGNGGLSIRDVSIMKDICKRHKFIDGNEDVFFCKIMEREGYNLADKDIAKQFSVETIFYDRPIGVHACWKYLKKNQILEIFNKAIEDL